MDITFLMLGCSIFIILGFGHAALILFTRKFEPKDPELLEKLKQSRTGMSNTGNIWNGVRGFHISHSLGLIIFGGFYVTLAVENSSYLKSSMFLNGGLFVVPIIYIILAHKFWYNVPRNFFIAAFCLLTLSVIFR